ncbi:MULTISPECIES: phage/plasmid primase, P4 family [unclassified Virgibacillus]|uniref:phage/plasmid primase, P4 family n=1 Tax=unclassified Virgibacillus TaxID=2620237 RepID=UPI00090A3C78|nr:MULTISPECIES: phage/plasmid primase, P4 family [unclassified Virgibacillus]API93994.1 DNA primase [Virgibacillus sp. 6R]MBS7427451.1 DNA primase [Virgibacillus sp. 19R1-5]
MLKYIELNDNKEPVHKLSTFSTDHKNYKNAAVLLDNKTVVVDFDEPSSVEIGNLIYNQNPTLKVHTKRGFHLYYRKPKGVYIKNWVGKLTNAGILVDYKHTSKQPIIIKQNNKLRKMDNGNLLGEWSSLPELPFLLWPNKLTEVLYGLTDGQGRNSNLYSHLLTAKEMYKRDVKEIATFINKYVFADALKERELENILGSVNSKKIDESSNQFLNKKDMIMTSEVLVEKLDIHYFRSKIFFKQDGHYISDENLLLRAIDRLIKLKPSQHKELKELFKIKATLQDDDDLPVQFNNGYCLYDNEIVEVDPGFTPFFLDVAYKENVYDEHVDKFLKWFTCNRMDLRQFIEEVFGHIIMTKGFPHRAFFFWGESGDNGKSTLIKMIQSFAEGLHTNVPLDKFDDDTTVFSLIGRLLNVADDINASYLDKSSNFKTIVSGDPVMIRPIYSPATTLNNKGTLIFTCNEIPVFKDKSGGIKKRMRVIPCDAVVEERDMEIDNKLSTDNAKSYILRLAIEGMQRIIKQGDLSDCKAITDITKEYFVQSDSVLGFLENYSVDGKDTKNAYMQYTLYCDESGLKAVGSTEFGRRLKKEGYDKKRVTKGNKRPWIYKKLIKNVSDNALNS